MLIFRAWATCGFVNNKIWIWHFILRAYSSKAARRSSITKKKKTIYLKHLRGIFYMLSLRPPTILTTNRWKNNEAADIVASLLDFLLQNTGKVIIGSFSIDDRGGKENVTLKMKIQNCGVYSNSLKMSNLGGISLEMISWGPHLSLERERKIRRCLFTSVHKA